LQLQTKVIIGRYKLANLREKKSQVPFYFIFSVGETSFHIKPKSLYCKVSNQSCRNTGECVCECV